jgi:hypothetical protein
MATWRPKGPRVGLMAFKSWLTPAWMPKVAWG